MLSGVSKTSLVLIICIAACTISGRILQQAQAGTIFEDLEFSLFINDRIHVLGHFFDSAKENFSHDRTFHVLYLNPSLSLSPVPHIRIVMEVEGQFTFDFKKDDDESDIDLRSAYLQLAAPRWPWLNLSLGQQAITTMDGLVYDDESPCVRIKGDLERGFSLPVKVDVLFTEIKDRSPYINIELKYCYSLLESVRLLYGWFRDYENGVAKIFNYLERQRIHTSRGRVQWIGASTSTFVGSALVKTTGIFEYGSTRLKKLHSGTNTFTTRGYAVDIQAEYSFSPKLSGGIFFYLASGDSNPRRGTLKSFLSIDPYIDKTNIYFNGGIDSLYSSDNVGLGGIQPSGILAPGIFMEGKISDTIFLKLVLARLLTHRHADGEGRDYGWEGDVTGYYMIGKNLQLFTEVNLLKPGSYFRRLTERRDRIANEFLFGINYLFNN